MRQFLSIFALSISLADQLFATKDHENPKTATVQVATRFSEALDQALPLLTQGKYMSVYIALSRLEGPFDTSQMDRKELISYGHFIFAKALCQAVLLPTIPTRELAQHYASNLLTAAEVLDQIGDPKFFIVRYFLEESTLKEWITHIILYPKQIQGNYSEYLSEPDKERLRLLMKRVEDKKATKSKL